MFNVIVDKNNKKYDVKIQKSDNKTDRTKIKFDLFYQNNFIGYISLTFYEGDFYAFINDAFLNEDYQKLGIYTNMISLMTNYVKTEYNLKGIVSEKNNQSTNAKAFWKKYKGNVKELSNGFYVEKKFNMITTIKEFMILERDYPKSFDMNYFKTLNSFNDRISYCNNMLQRMTSGSSRVIYKIDDDKVLKLAKNKKGILQCENEISWGKNNYYNNILAQTIDEHENAEWVEMELAQKIKENDFLRIEGFKFDDYCSYIRNECGPYKGFKIDKEQKEILDESEFVNTIISFIRDSDSPVGDLTRLNSYGMVKHDDIDSIVIIDYGLNYKIFNTHYSRRR